MKKLINKFKELYKKSSLFRIFIILLIGALIIFEGKNIYVDYYNFQQLEKAKKVIENIPERKKTYTVSNLKQLNSKFKADIEPLDKRYCYYVYYNFNKEANKADFEFGFKLHSLLYKLKYLSFNYAYPIQIKPVKLPNDCKNDDRPLFPGGIPGGVHVTARCMDFHYIAFENAINNPCEK